MSTGVDAQQRKWETYGYGHSPALVILEIKVLRTERRLRESVRIFRPHCTQGSGCQNQAPTFLPLLDENFVCGPDLAERAF
jgi:hypothetical protein